jgi:hypothetical protein
MIGRVPDATRSLRPRRRPGWWRWQGVLTGMRGEQSSGPQLVRITQLLRCAEHFRVMAFAQLTYRERLRDIEACLSAQAAKLYHMGFRELIRRSTLSDANEARDWRIYADFAQVLIRQAQSSMRWRASGWNSRKTVYALDSTTIDLCLSVSRGRLSVARLEERIWRAARASQRGALFGGRDPAGIAAAKAALARRVIILGAAEGQSNKGTPNAPRTTARRPTGAHRRLRRFLTIATRT